MSNEFEEWWLEGVYPLRRIDRFEDAGVYEELVYEIWQASRESIKVDLPTFYGYKDHIVRELQAAFIQEVERQGLKVKP